MQSIITASLCDSRSCNQTGGGEHLKSDIEDLLTLLPPPPSAYDDVGYDNNDRGRQRQRVSGAGGPRRKHHPNARHRHRHRVVLTTCFGLCNHSPNIQLKSSGGPPSLRARRGKLVNDGGFRMRLRLRLEEGDDDKDSQSQQQHQQQADDMEATDTAMISNATISKVARAIGLLKHDNANSASASAAVRALECQSQGNKFQRNGNGNGNGNGRYDDALDCYLEGRRQALLSLRTLTLTLCSNNNDDDEDEDGGNHELKLQLQSQSLAINKLLSKMILSCSKTRIQWATELMVMVMDDDNDDRDGDAKKEEASSKMLQLAAGDAFCVLLKSLKEEKEKEDGGDANKNGTTTTTTTATRRRSSFSGDETNGTVDVQSIIFEMVHSSTAGLQTQKFISNYEDCVVRGASSSRNTHHSRGEEDERSFAVPSLFGDNAIMVQFCVVLADAWKGLAATRRTSDNNDGTDDGNDAAHAFTNGALVAYKGALDIASSASKGRILRAKERRRIEKAMAALV